VNTAPILLSIETSGTVCGINLLNAATHESLADLIFSEPYQHDHLLAEAVRTLCAMLGVSIPGLAGVAVSAGPGSFMGLRIGAAFAKALCFEDVPPLIPVPTMPAIAFAARQAAVVLGKSQVCAITPSHKNLVYVQTFSNDLTPSSVLKTAPQLVPAQSIVPSETTFYCGAAFAPSGTSSAFVNPAFTRLAQLSCPTPAMIGSFAAELFHAYTETGAAFAPSSAFVPMYAQEFIPKTA
jgi:tRNA threonylcarbamoyl adenosine modification protein YeaZ